MRRQTTTPHNSCDRSPVRQLRSLLRHPRPCGDTVGTCDALCGRAWHCSRCCAAYSPYSLRTFSTAEPSIGMGTTLGRGSDLDRSKTHCPQDPRNAATLNAGDGTFYRSHHAARWSCQDTGVISARPRTTPKTAARLAP